MEFRIDELLDGFEDQSVPIQAVPHTSPDRIKELTMKKIKQDYTGTNRRRGARKLFTVMLAAVLVLALTAAAYAAFSIHQKNQQKLRESLKIEEHQVESYVEYTEPQVPSAEVPEKQEPQQKTVTLVSAIRDGNFQRVYVNLSPVTREEALEATANEVIGYSFDGGVSGNFAMIPYDVERQSEFEEIGPEQLQQLRMDYSYDEQTETLLLRCSVAEDDLPESGPLTLDILRINGFQFEQVYGSVSFEPTELELRQITFDTPIELYNETLQESCYVVGVQLTPASAAYMVELNNGETLFSPGNLTDEEREALMSWIVCTDPPLSGAVLIFEDGSEFATGTIAGCPYENGYVMHRTWWETTTINIHEVASVRIADETRACNE